ncbi:M28 family peptidase [Thalassotalea hakodatensis]|uniref:M28 family peptidase n=1 Tax=Thalassotalea hakodatensis TaxID=3030492 RepID=UPI0025734F5D|nr:M20/M25/M40 family metallo-hydrolase [Thalassotalea hakodatensis]
MITITKSALALAASVALSSTVSFATQADNTSFNTITKDITFLASDELKGRGNFSKEIDQAANYISQRFSEIGLVPMQGENTFKQSFTVTTIKPKSIAVTLNGNTIESAQLGLASTIEKIQWQNTDDFTLHTVGKNDNMSQVISGINQQGGKHLVLINPAHKKLFARYSGYFARGLNKLSLEHQGAIVMIMTEDSAIDAISISADTSITGQTLTNVVGVLPGKQQKDEIVLYSAHYDHLGASQSGEGDVIYNGADDDASGTTAVINLAEYFTHKGDNARTLIFSAFTAEEIGGFGSQYFSKQLNPDDVVAMINIEMIGKPSKFGAGNVWMTGMDRSSLGEELNKALAGKDFEIYKDPYPKQNLFYRSDNATLARLGVPAHSFSSTQLDKDQHYHKVTDDLASLDLTSMHQVIESLSIATQGLVDGKITPTRVDVNKVKSRGKIY